MKAAPSARSKTRVKLCLNLVGPVIFILILVSLDFSVLTESLAQASTRIVVASVLAQVAMVLTAGFALLCLLQSSGNEIPVWQYWPSFMLSRVSSLVLPRIGDFSIALLLQAANVSGSKAFASVTIDKCVRFATSLSLGLLGIVLLIDNQNILHYIPPSLLVVVTLTVFILQPTVFFAVIPERIKCHHYASTLFSVQDAFESFSKAHKRSLISNSSGAFCEWC